MELKDKSLTRLKQEFSLARIVVSLFTQPGRGTNISSSETVKPSLRLKSMASSSVQTARALPPSPNKARNHLSSQTKLKTKPTILCLVLSSARTASISRTSHRRATSNWSSLTELKEKLLMRCAICVSAQMGDELCIWLSVGTSGSLSPGELSQVSMTVWLALLITMGKTRSTF